ncbi:Glutamyl-tRNA(Gln) amidotransferase subunit A [Tsuneonella dongtanensis]|uniref:Glutamyl-tRNA(Gln) amidotransferase subunit A n=2 Tax=Tsuneonella dongtanensis TaxID=692370 RepID=A0A1B2AFK2_9SPHN|nr:Glutamyl-tRNA(Gln) amidotransferase subunit A [Tsuneonella dongtanensis]
MFKGINLLPAKALGIDGRAVHGSVDDMKSNPKFVSFAVAMLSITAGSKLSASEPVDEAARTASYLSAIRSLDDGGPMLNAVIVYDRDAPEKSRAAADAGPLKGRFILVKDNVETREWPTTAGSLALKDNRTGRDAPPVARIRAAGGVILGKTNLSEWANIRSNDSSSGWSAIGGQTRNPHAIDRNPCGSSSGSGAAIAAGMAWAAIGTETNGSITCPASVNGIVGFKPTVGLVSRTHIVPISVTQDTAGPMARSVADAALLLSAIAGSDPADPATAEADQYKTDFTRSLDTASLKGVRIGVLRNQAGTDPRLLALFEQARADMERAGAVFVDVDFQPEGSFWQRSLQVLLFELREGMDEYLATRPVEGGPRSLAEVVAFNKANAAQELRWFDQGLFEQSLTTTDAAAYRAARDANLRATREDGIDRLLREQNLAVLVAPTMQPAWPIDLLGGDNFGGRVGAGYLAAIAGYPHLTVPMGAVERLPVGISFMGGKWQDHAILKIGAAYERARSASVPVPSFLPWSPVED